MLGQLLEDLRIDGRAEGTEGRTEEDGNERMGGNFSRGRGGGEVSHHTVLLRRLQPALLLILSAVQIGAQLQVLVGSALVGHRGRSV